MSYRIDNTPLSSFSILASSQYAADAALLAQKLNDAFGVILPVVETAQAPCISFDSACESYFQYRAVLRRCPEGLVLDGETPFLRERCMDFLVESLTRNEPILEQNFVYHWRQGECSKGLRLLALRREVGDDGVTYYEADYRNAAGEPVLGFAVVGDPAKTRIAVEAAPSGVTEWVATHAANAEARGETVLAGANAGFFHFFSQNSDLTPYGPQIVDGNVLCPPSTVQRYGDLYVGATHEGEVIFSDCAGYYEKYEGKLRYAVGGGPMLMTDRVIPPVRPEDPTAASYFPRSDRSGPCTFVAHAPDGTFGILCADGRQERSVGMTAADKVQFALDLDCGFHNIFNLDGGGSTVLIRRNREGGFDVKNIPCSDPQRPVADAIFLVKK